jgi:poly-gamma-glutamate capsule biosynthesis protein CapA/YwtB (metallophosphatase superfamily)
MVGLQMKLSEFEFIHAADELYSAFCRSAVGSRQTKALQEFARASNAWEDHPGKVAERERRQQPVASYSDEVRRADVDRIDKLVAPEFQSGDWQDVEVEK